MLTPHDLTLLPRGTQAGMTGDDWLSDRDRKAQARAEAARKKAALIYVAKRRGDSAGQALKQLVAKIFNAQRRATA